MDSYEDISNVCHPWDQLSATHLATQRAQSTSCLDLNTSTDIDKLRSLLPSYRPAPDYETAVQQKYRNSSGGAIPTREPIRNAHPMLYSSQPEIHQTDGFASHLRYPDVTHNNVEQKNVVTSLYNPGYTQSQILPTENPHNVVDLTEGLRLIHLYKPPPPYPANRINSNSTPDLAGISQQAKPQINFINNLVSGSSPDLVSNGNLINQHYLKHYGQAMYANPHAHPVHRSQSYLPAPQHSTYENLTSFFENNMVGRPQAVIVDNPNVTKHIKKVYDEHGNIIYCMPANMKQILQENQLPSTGFVVTRNQNAVVTHAQDLNNSTEPIYENIPLPWRKDSGQMRARTQSVQSAPEISQVLNHTLINNVQTQAAVTTPQLKESDNSRENLYANIDRNINNPNSSKTDLNLSTNTNNLGSTSSLLNQSSSNQNFNSTAISSFKNTSGESSHTINRMNTFTINKSSSNSSAASSFLQNTSNNNSNEVLTDLTSSTNSNSSKTKRKRWGILMGKSKSSDKVKSATLGREKDKSKDKNQSNNRHRWSTGLPRLHPLPPTISKETMVSFK